MRFYQGEQLLNVGTKWREFCSTLCAKVWNFVALQPSVDYDAINTLNLMTENSTSEMWQILATDVATYTVSIKRAEETARRTTWSGYPYDVRTRNVSASDKALFGRTTFVLPGPLCNKMAHPPIMLLRCSKLRKKISGYKTGKLACLW